MSKLYLVRHGRTAWHEEGRYAGTADIPLDGHGRDQVARVVEALQEVPLECVYSSPLSRCSELAQKVAESHGLEVNTDERLREIDLGRWDGETYKEIFERDGDVLRLWTEDPVSITIPGGESLIAVQERAMRWFADAVGRYPDGKIFASSHGGPIRAILASVLGLPLSHVFRLTVDLASISVVNYKGEFSNLQQLNETCHLDGI